MCVLLYYIIKQVLFQPKATVHTSPRPKHENGEITKRSPRVKKPVMEVPQKVDEKTVEEDGLVSPEVPSEALDSHDRLAVDGDGERVRAVHRDVVPRAVVGESGSGGVHGGGARAVLSPGHQPRRTRHVSLGAQREPHLGVERGHHGERAGGLGPSVELGGGEVPRELRVAGEGLASLPLAARVEVELERVR